MSAHEAPAYFCVTDDISGPPSAESCTEGRLFLDETELVCGAGDPDVQEGYIGRVDSHAGSTVRRLFGGLKGFQEFEVAAARTREATRSLALDAVTGVETVEWEGSELVGADRTYGVRVESPRLADGTLVVQLGRGWRNRGSDRERHVALARLLRAKADADEPSNEKTVGDDKSSNAMIDGDDKPSSAKTDGNDDPSNADDDEVPWLTDEEGSTALVARNYTDRPTTARIGCRTDEGVQFREDATFAGLERKQWTDLPEDRSFEIGVVPEDGESAAATVDGTDAVEGDIQVYLTPEEVTIDTSADSSATTDSPAGPATTADHQQATDGHQRGAREEATDSDTDAGGSRLRGAAILAIGFVVWFGSPALDPSFLLPIFDTSPRMDPSLAQQLTQIREIVAVSGALVTFYGLYRLVKGR